MQVEQGLLLLRSPLGVDDGRVEVVVVSTKQGSVPVPALLAAPALDAELALHHPCDVGPFALAPLLFQEFEDLVLLLAPYFPLRHRIFI